MDVGSRSGVQRGTTTIFGIFRRVNVRVCECVQFFTIAFFFHAGCKQYIGILGASLPGTGHWHEINVTETNGYMRTINKSNDSWVGARRGRTWEREREKKTSSAVFISAHDKCSFTFFTVVYILYSDEKKTPKQNKNARIVFDTINNPRSATMRLMVCVLRASRWWAPIATVEKRLSYRTVALSLQRWDTRLDFIIFLKQV